MNKEIAKEKSKNNEKDEDIKINQLHTIKIKTLKNYCSKNKFFEENCELSEIVGYGSESIVCTCILKKSKQKNIIIAKIIFNNEKSKMDLSEKNIISKVKNKNIIDFYGYSIIIENKIWCIYMENGIFGNLNNFRKNILKTNYLSESMLCFIAHQILNGLFYCHKSKIAHMDIKLSNIVVDKFLNFKIIDFSLSINYQDKNPNDIIKLPLIGTSFYMPLEILFNNNIKYEEINKVDLYSFGVILYNLAFNAFPYNLTYNDQEKYSQILTKILINNIGLNSDGNSYSNYFLDFLNKLLEKDIKKRINIFKAKEHHWIKGSKILLDEKEKINNINIFILHLLGNYSKEFNDYNNKSK